MSAANYFSLPILGEEKNLRFANKEKSSVVITYECENER
jgi:hypothetical protein